MILVVPVALSVIADYDESKQFSTTNRATFNELNITEPGTKIVIKQHKWLSAHTIGSLRIQNTICHFFPRDFEFYYWALFEIIVNNSELKVITKEDLEPFPLLQVLVLKGNALTSLEPELFVFNPELTTVHFTNNRIRTISADIYDHIKYDARIEFGHNVCIENATRSMDTTEVTRMIVDQCQLSLRELDDSCDLIYAEWILKEMNPRWIGSHLEITIFESFEPFVKFIAILFYFPLFCVYLYNSILGDISRRFRNVMMDSRMN